MQPPAVIREAAPAKINLSLRVLGRRTDGYHELESLVAFALSAADEVEFTPGASIGVSTTGRFAGGLTGENIAEAALKLLADRAPGLRLGTVRLTKNLPVAAGIGGGSADAAALLRAVRAANGEAARDIDWLQLAARLGADVPVCFASRASVMHGIGDNLRPVAKLPSVAVVLANAMRDVPADKTALVFKRLAAPPFEAGRKDERLAPQFATADELVAHIAATGNDLTAAAVSLSPEIEDVLGQLQASGGCKYAALSGAGPTCFGVYGGLADAESAAEEIAAERPGWWVCASALG